MVFHPPHGDECPVCREQIWHSLTPAQRRQQYLYGAQAVGGALAFTFLVLALFAWIG